MRIVGIWEVNEAGYFDLEWRIVQIQHKNADICTVMFEIAQYLLFHKYNDTKLRMFWFPYSKVTAFVSQVYVLSETP